MEQEIDTYSNLTADTRLSTAI